MKQLVMGLLVSTGALVAGSPVFSQDAISAESGNTAKVSSLLPGLSNEMVNPKAQKDFQKKFTGVNDEKWFRSDNNYILRFTDNSIHFKVEYDRKGKWTSTQKDYPGEKLADDGRALIKNNFFDYSIVWVTEFLLPEFYNPVYLVRIENKKDIKSICINEGEIRIVEEYSKAQ